MEAAAPKEGDPEPPRGFGGQTRKNESYEYHKTLEMRPEFDRKAAKP